MKKLLVAVVAGVSLVGCGTETVVKKVPPPDQVGEEPGEATDQPDPGSNPPTPPKTPAGASQAPEDRCLDNQDLNAADVDIASCPAIPSMPAAVPIGTAAKDKISLGAWEIGTTAEGATYVYGELSAPTANPRTLTFEGGSTTVNQGNLDCWAKGYYRLRKILQDPPAEWLALRNAGFQFRFFQFQTDLRNGPTGYKAISSFQDHLVKWVTVINAQGVCEQPTLAKFKTYLNAELTKRNITVPAPTP